MTKATDYKAAPVTWRRVKTTRKDGTTTEQWQAILRVGRLGNGRYAKRSKLFPAEIDTERKRNAALRRWRAELEAEEAQRIEREKQEALRQQGVMGGHSLVSEYVKSYIDELERLQAVESRTVSDYRTTARGIDKGFPGVTMAELTPAMVQK